jgi:thiol-disulfide isomerase/thioredoxin
MISLLKDNKFILLFSIFILFGIGIYIISSCDNISNFKDLSRDNVSLHNVSNSKDKFSNHTNKPTLSLYYAKWCGHCNTFKPTWEQIKTDQNNLNFIDFNTIDCSGDSKETTIYSTPNGTELDGFPTIILSINNKDKIYNGQRNKKAIEDYIKKELLI